jgi:hypothetical protein
MGDKRPQLWIPLLLLQIIVLGTSIIWIQATIEYNSTGEFVYPLDDAYIHLSVARNLSEYGKWGLTPTEFSTPSSSLLWPIVLSVMSGFSPRVLVPLVANLLFLSVLSWLTWKFLVDSNVNAWLAALITLIALLLSTMLPIALTGMEHVLHTLLTLSFLLAAVNGARNEFQEARSRILITTLALLLGGVRYEALPLIGLVAVAIAFRRQYRFAAIVVTAGATLPIAFAVMAFLNDAPLLPTPILLKAALPGVRALGGSLKDYFLPLDAATSFSLLSVCIWAYLTKRESAENSRYLVAAIILTIVCVFERAVGFRQFEFALGYSRYTSYMLFVIFSFTALGVLRIYKISILAAGSVVLLTLWLTSYKQITNRTVELHRDVSLATRNIASQQIQMAKFVNEFSPNSRIGLNDIGAVSFMTRAHLLDLWGLGSIPIARMRLHENIGPKLGTLAQANSLDFLMIYDQWYLVGVPLPEGLYPIGKFWVKDNAVLGGDAVTFYATRKTLRDSLAKSMRSFASQMPMGASVEVF